MAIACFPSNKTWTSLRTRACSIAGNVSQSIGKIVRRWTWSSRSRTSYCTCFTSCITVVWNIMSMMIIIWRSIKVASDLLRHSRWRWKSATNAGSKTSSRMMHYLWQFRGLWATSKRSQNTRFNRWWRAEDNKLSQRKKKRKNQVWSASPGKKPKN